MFCIKCGAQLPDDARFCSECGSPQAPYQENEAPDVRRPQSAAPTATASRASVSTSTGQERYPHPYHRLGGWLALIYYGQLIAVGLMALGFVVGLIPSFGIIRFMGRGHVVALLIQLAGYLLCCYFCLKFAGMLKRKEPGFLRFYELTMITLCVINIAAMFLMGVGFGAETVRPILSAVLFFVIWTTYFRKSVRVRTYMGSDAYLRNSIFFRNSVAPLPADMRPNTQRP